MNLFEYLAEMTNWTRPSTGIMAHLGQHLGLTLLGVGIAAVIAIPLGMLIGHTHRGRHLLAVLGALARAVPWIGLVVVFVLLVGVDGGGVLVTLVIAAAPVILMATATATGAADPDAVHSARALGLSPIQVAATIEWPLALPQILIGVRTATLLVVATVTISAYAGASGLGRLLVEGQRQGQGGYPQMFAGAVLVAAVAVLLHSVLTAASWAAKRASRRSARFDDLIPLPSA